MRCALSRQPIRVLRGDQSAALHPDRGSLGPRWTDNDGENKKGEEREIKEFTPPLPGQTLHYRSKHKKKAGGENKRRVFLNSATALPSLARVLMWKTAPWVTYSSSEIRGCGWYRRVSHKWSCWPPSRWCHFDEWSYKNGKQWKAWKRKWIQSWRSKMWLARPQPFETSRLYSTDMTRRKLVRKHVQWKRKRKLVWRG